MDQPRLPAADAMTPQLLQAFEQSDEAIVVVDPCARVVVANRCARDLFSDDGLIGLDARQVLPASLFATPATARHEAAATTVELARRDGTRFAACVSARSIGTGKQRFNACYIRDVGNDAHRQAHSEPLLAVSESRNAVVVCDARSRITYANRSFTRMFDFTLDDVLGRRPDEILLGSDRDLDVVARMRSLCESGQSYDVELLACTRRGVPFWAGISANPIRDGDGRITHYVGIVADLTHRRLHETLQHRVLESLVRGIPVADVLAAMCQDMRRFAPDIVASILKIDPHGQLRRLAAPDLPPELADLLDGRDENGRCGVWHDAARNGRPLLCEDNAAAGEWSAAHAPPATGRRWCPPAAPTWACSASSWRRPTTWCSPWKARSGPRASRSTRCSALPSRSPTSARASTTCAR